MTVPQCRAAVPGCNAADYQMSGRPPAGPAPMLLSAPADIVALVIGLVVVIDLLKPRKRR